MEGTVRWETSQARGIMSRRQNAVIEKSHFKYAEIIEIIKIIEVAQK